MTIPANVIFMWTGTHAGIPAGWSRETGLDAKFPKATAAGVAPNVTGGAATHTHTSPEHSHTLANHTHPYTLTSAGTTTEGGDPSAGTKQGIIDTHTHTGTSGSRNGGTTQPTAVTYGSVSNNPPFYEVLFLKSNGAAIANNMVALWSGASVPSGWANCDGTSSTPNMVNRFIRGAGGGQNGGATGGSSQNTHDISHTHLTTAHTHDAAASNASGNTTVGGDSNNAVSSGHTHDVSLNADTQPINSHSGSLVTAETVEPAYKKVMAIQNQTGGASKPVGIIGLWLGALNAIPAGWFLCDGNNGTPDLRDKYIKIATNAGEIGNTGGSNSHAHAAQSHSHTGNGNHQHTANVPAHTHSPIIAQAANATHRAMGGSVHPASVGDASANYDAANTTADTTSNEPEYRTVAYIMFKRNIGAGAFFAGIL